MSDTLYLSLWYPNLRLTALPDKLTAVLDAFAAHGGEARVYSATVWPVSWSESPVFEQVYGRRIGAASDGTAKLGAEPRLAVEEALELLHDDFAYEFQIGWSLWELENTPVEAGSSTSLRFAQDDSGIVGLDPRWVREPRMVRVTGFGPLFEDGAYEADGHIRIDFGSDTPFLEEDLELDSVAARHVEENVRQLVELTAAVEKASGATARLLWSELGKPGAAASSATDDAAQGDELTVRFTIERMRALVVAAGVLLVAALVIFLAVGKWKNPFNRRDLPQRLGIEIQSDSGGVTYTQAHGGHTLFKIHASKVVQLKKGNALLHDVKIELYGADGSSVDRIEGAEFEYDQKSGTAIAAGQVEITLMRPGVAPAVAPKAAAGPAVGGKLKGAPVASAVEAAAQGEVQVKTSGLTFDQKSGVATTSQHVDFSMVQGSGSSMGATYDSQQGMLVLDRAVELSAQRGPQTVQIHAQHAEFERTSQVCRMRAATAAYQGGDAVAGDAKILFREDGSAVRLDAMNGFTLTTATGGSVKAPSGHMDFDERNQPRHGRLEGGVTIDSTSQTGTGDGLRRRQLHGSAPTADLEFNAQGKLRHARLERGVAMDSEEQSEQKGQKQQLNRHWRSPIADIDFRDSGQGQVEPRTVHGTGGVVVTGESQRGTAAATESRLSADTLTGEFGPGSVLAAMNGVGRASIEETTETGTRQATSGDRLEAHFAAPADTGEKPGAKPSTVRGPGGAAQIESATIEGHVLLTQAPVSKPGAPPPSPLRATAGRADYEATGQWLHLTLSPRVEDGALQLTGDKVDVSRASGDAFAHGNVKASWTDAGARNDGRKGNAALGGQGPAHVVAAEAQLHQLTGEATFRGQARLWQQANSVTAPVIVLDRVRQTLVARATDFAEPVRVVLVTTAGQASGTDPGKRAGKEQQKSDQPAVIRARGGDLKYSDAERKAVLHGGVLGAVTAETGTAISVSNELEITLLPGGNHAGKDGVQAQVDHMTARGHVMLTSEGRRGTGEQLVYTGATGEYVLTGTASNPPKMSDPERGTVTGEALIFHGRDDSVTVEGGGRKTMTQTTAPK
jgi:lipopolysaccharide export system protein LptA